MGDSEIIMCVTLPQSDMAMGEILIVFFFLMRKLIINFRQNNVWLLEGNNIVFYVFGCNNSYYLIAEHILYYLCYDVVTHLKT